MSADRGPRCRMKVAGPVAATQRFTPPSLKVSGSWLAYRDGVGSMLLGGSKVEQFQANIAACPQVGTALILAAAYPTGMDRRRRD